MALCAKALGKNEEYLKFLKLTCEYDAEEARAVLGEYFPADVQPKDYYTYAKRQLIGG